MFHYVKHDGTRSFSVCYFPVFGFKLNFYPANKYILKFSNRNAIKMCEICSKFVNDVILVSLLLTYFLPVSIVDFEHAFVCWGMSSRL